jgi:hypothetical protein
MLESVNSVTGCHDDHSLLADSRLNDSPGGLDFGYWKPDSLARPLDTDDDCFWIDVITIPCSARAGSTHRSEAEPLALGIPLVGC